MWREKQAFSLVFRIITLYWATLSKAKSEVASTLVGKLFLEFSYFISSGIPERQVLAHTSESVLQGNPPAAGPEPARQSLEAAVSWLLTSSVSTALLCHAFKYLPFTTRFWFFSQEQLNLCWATKSYFITWCVLPSYFFLQLLLLRERTFCFTNENGGFYLKKECFCLLSAGHLLYCFITSNLLKTSSYANCAAAQQFKCSELRTS